MLHPPAARLLIPILVAYQVAWDFVDTMLERPTPAAGPSEDVRRALVAAVSVDEVPGLSLSDDRGPGFLAELVRACRDGCRRLPGYDDARIPLQRAAARSDALLVTNGPREDKTRALNEWAADNEVGATELEPAELCAAAQCSLGIHALLATAARPSSRPAEFAAIEAAYYPWVDALCTLLDSLVDQDDDHRTGEYSFVGQYQSSDHAAERFRLIAKRALKATDALPAGHRHAALVCAVVGMYLSAPVARSPSVRAIAESVAEATAPRSGWACAVAARRRRSRSKDAAAV